MGFGAGRILLDRIREQAETRRLAELGRIAEAERRRVQNAPELPVTNPVDPSGLLSGFNAAPSQTPVAPPGSISAAFQTTVENEAPERTVTPTIATAVPATTQTGLQQIETPAQSIAKFLKSVTAPPVPVKAAPGGNLIGVPKVVWAASGIIVALGLLAQKKVK